MHETRLKIRSTQVDLFGHLNNAVYLELYEWARWEWAEANGMETRRMIDEFGVGPAILHIDLRFHRELLLNEEVVIRTWSQELSRFQGVVAQQMRKPDGTLASEARFTYVMIDLKTRKIVSAPEPLRRMHEADAAARQEHGQGGD